MSHYTREVEGTEVIDFVPWQERKEDITPLNKLNGKLVHSHPAVKDFLALTAFTCPHGHENTYYDAWFEQRGAKVDAHGNYWIVVPGDSTTLFAAHLDTADARQARVRHVYKKGNMLTTDGTSLLGADDRAGVAVLLHLIRNQVPGVYVFFVGEEVGRLGSEAVAKATVKHAYRRVIQWDRRGYGSIITEQMGEQTASDEFAEALAAQYAERGLVMHKDPGGSFTDSYSFRGVVSECTNISIGYFGAHSTAEVQDLNYLVEMADASVSIDWEALPSVREPVVRSYTYRYSYGSYGKGGYASSGWGSADWAWDEGYQAGYEDGYSRAETEAARDLDLVVWKRDAAVATGKAPEYYGDWAGDMYVRASNGEAVSLAEIRSMVSSEPEEAVLLIDMLLSSKVGD